MLLVSSVLVTVPSDDWVTVFSFDLTVPSLLVLLLSVLETVRSHPTNRNDNAKADVAVKKITLQFFILFVFRGEGGQGDNASGMIHNAINCLVL